MSLIESITGFTGTLGIGDLTYRLVKLLLQLPEDLRILIVASSSEQQSVLTKHFPNITTVTEDNLVKISGEHYDYLFWLSLCDPGGASKLADHTIVDSTQVADNYISPLRHNRDIHYYPDLISLEDPSQFTYLVAKEVARLAYLNLRGRILVLAASSDQSNSIIDLLRQARVPLPSISINEAVPKASIIVTERSIGILFSSLLEPDLVIDTMTELQWVPTWTQGRRQQIVYISKEQTDTALAINAVMYRMTPVNFTPKQTPRVCHWRRWLENPTRDKPLSIAKCWHHLDATDPKLKEFLLEVPLGLRPALVLWKWHLSEHPLASMIILIALIDSFDASYFQWPPRKPQFEDNDDTYRLIRLKHSQRYFYQFVGKTDFETLLNIWKHLYSYAEQRTEEGAAVWNTIPLIVHEWAQSTSMNPHKILEVYGVATQLFDYFSEKPSNISYKDAFLKEAYPIFAEIYCDHHVKKMGGIYISPGHQYFMTGNQMMPSGDHYPDDLYAIVVHRDHLWVTMPADAVE